jgi:hypothetical protein
MGEYLPILLAVVAVVAIISVVVAVERKRREALRVVARKLGLRFDHNADRRLHRTYSHSVFGKGHSQKATNNLFGTMPLAGYEIRVRMGDFRYVTGHGKHRQTHNISYALFHLPFAGTPDLLIRKEHLGDKLVGGIGFDDIDFESEEFSRKFWVKSGDKRFAYDVVHPGMMEFLLEGPTPHVEIVGDTCLVLEGWGRWDPDTFEGAPGWFQAFLERWPEHLTDRLVTRQEGTP